MSPLVWVALLLTVAGIVFLLDRLATRILSPAPRPIQRTPADTGIPFEELEIRSGKHELHAWLLQPEQAQPFEPLVVIAHGWSAHHGTVLSLGEPLARAGHDVLLYDVRGHGRNPRLPRITVRDFRDDLMAVTRFASKRFPDRQLVVIGHSFGGAAGVLAAADGAPVDGLVLIAAPSDVLRVTAEFLTSEGMPGGLMVRILRPPFWLRVRGSFRPLTPGRRIRELDLPLLIIQPELDRRVVRRHAEQLSSASGEPIHIVEERGHTDVLTAPETLRLVREFLEAL